MRFLALAVFLLSACGPVPCEDPDFVAAGLCVTTNNHLLRRDFVELTVKRLERSLQWFQIDLSLATKFGELEAGVEVVERDDERLAKHELQGLQDERLAIITLSNCRTTSRLLGHELLHIISRYFLGGSRDDNCSHSIPYMFKEWEEMNPSDPSIEGLFMEETVGICALINFYEED